MLIFKGFKGFLYDFKLCFLSSTDVFVKDDGL